MIGVYHHQHYVMFLVSKRMAHVIAFRLHVQSVCISTHAKSRLAYVVFRALMVSFLAKASVLAPQFLVSIGSFQNRLLAISDSCIVCLGCNIGFVVYKSGTFCRLGELSS